MNELPRSPFHSARRSLRPSTGHPPHSLGRHRGPGLGCRPHTEDLRQHHLLGRPHGRRKMEALRRSRPNESGRHRTDDSILRQLSQPAKVRGSYGVRQCQEKAGPLDGPEGATSAARRTRLRSVEVGMAERRVQSNDELWEELRVRALRLNETHGHSEVPEDMSPSPVALSR